jgi:hypothetical protein
VTSVLLGFQVKEDTKSDTPNRKQEVQVFRSSISGFQRVVRISAALLSLVESDAGVRLVRFISNWGGATLGTPWACWLVCSPADRAVWPCAPIDVSLLSFVVLRLLIRCRLDKRVRVRFTM